MRIILSGKSNIVNTDLANSLQKAFINRISIASSLFTGIRTLNAIIDLGPSRFYYEFIKWARSHNYAIKDICDKQRGLNRKKIMLSDDVKLIIVDDESEKLDLTVRMAIHNDRYRCRNIHYVSTNGKVIISGYSDHTIYESTDTFSRDGLFDFIITSTANSISGFGDNIESIYLSIINYIDSIFDAKVYNEEVINETIVIDYGIYINIGISVIPD